MIFLHPKTENDFLSYITTNKFCLVDFYADWCKPCVKLYKYLSSISDKYNNLTVIKVNVDIVELKNICMIHSVNSLPCVIFYTNGILELVKIEGFGDKTIQTIQSYLDKTN